MTKHGLDRSKTSCNNIWFFSKECYSFFGLMIGHFSLPNYKLSIITYDSKPWPKSIVAVNFRKIETLSKCKTRMFDIGCIAAQEIWFRWPETPSWSNVTMQVARNFETWLRTVSYSKRYRNWYKKSIINLNFWCRPHERSIFEIIKALIFNFTSVSKSLLYEILM